MILKLKNVRLSFPALFTPEAFKPGDPLRFKASFLIPKGDAQVKVVEAAILETMTGKFQGKAQQIIDSIRTNANKFCFQDGDLKDYDGYAGHMALSSNSEVRPLVLDRNKAPLVAADGKPYAGCYVNAQVDLFAYANEFGKGISASLMGVQFLRDGDSFSGARPAAADDFDDIADTGDDDMADIA